MDATHIDASVAWKFRIVPAENAEDLFFHDGSKDAERLRKELSFLLDRPVRLEIRTGEEIEHSLHRLFPVNKKSDDKDIQGHVTLNENEQVIESLVSDAVDLNASDIHIEYGETDGRVRYRIDGKLLERRRIKQSEYPGLINRIKVKANINISEKRIPQDGRCHLKIDGKTYDLRISVMPSMYKEMAVIRILGNRNKPPVLTSLGLNRLQLESLQASLSLLQGLILISGPTGSGKTSTLYACLNELNTAQRNILTIEDPVEITLQGINQVQVRPEVGLGFSSALRAFLRQDPDVIMIGEIRDSETAEMAIRASMTGHLVISTIHTNSAWESLSRLADLGIPPFLLASTLSLSLAQRLVRVLCSKCKLTATKQDQNESFNELLGQSLFLKGSGCSECHMTGYKGRTACFEIIGISDQIRKQIADGNLSVDYRPPALPRIRHAAEELLNQGVTSYEEISPLLNL